MRLLREFSIEGRRKYIRLKSKTPRTKAFSRSNSSNEQGNLAPGRITGGSTRSGPLGQMVQSGTFP